MGDVKNTNDNKTKWHLKKHFHAVVITSLIAICTYFLGDFGNDSFKLTFTKDDLHKEVSKIIQDESLNGYQGFVNKHSYTAYQQNQILKLNDKNDKIDDTSLMYIYLLIEENYPLIDGDIQRESVRWSTWILVLFLALFTYAFDLYLSTLKEGIETSTKKLEATAENIKGSIKNTLLDWRDSDEDLLTKSVDSHFSKTIQKFADAHDGFINGMYDNYPKDFIQIFNKDGDEGIEKIKNSTKSLYLWMENIDVNEYSSLAEELLQYTETSVFSTTFFDNNDLIAELNKPKNNNSVLKWLKNVNNKMATKENGSFEIKRVHVFKGDILDDGPKSFTGFVRQINLEDNKEARKNYLNTYALCDYKTWHLIKGDSPHFFGEYIIFDNQIMIQYNEDFKVLELYIGSIVKMHTNQYTDSAISYKLEDKDGLINELDAS